MQSDELWSNQNQNQSGMSMKEKTERFKHDNNLVYN